MTRVYLEVGKTWSFACAVDWPGWCRRGKTREAALDALLDYAPRYRTVVGSGFEPGELSVLGTVPGTATTEFGAPDARGEWDAPAMAADELAAHLAVLGKSWRYFDRVVKKAPAELRKGPRGGGRDRDAIADHVREAERAYARKVGVRLPPRTPWPDQRREIIAAFEEGRVETSSWPPRYAIRRTTWHVLDHAWEIEDRSEGGRPAPR